MVNIVISTSRKYEHVCSLGSLDDLVKLSIPTCLERWYVWGTHYNHATQIVNSFDNTWKHGTSLI